MIRRYDTVEAQRLMGRIMTRKEYETWETLLRRIEAAPETQGARELNIEAERRKVVITIYVSQGLKVIFVLGYHLVRDKEPTQHQVETIRAYVKEIQELEARP